MANHKAMDDWITEGHTIHTDERFEGVCITHYPTSATYLIWTKDHTDGDHTHPLSGWTNVDMFTHYGPRDGNGDDVTEAEATAIIAEHWEDMLAEEEDDSGRDHNR